MGSISRRERELILDLLDFGAFYRFSDKELLQISQRNKEKLEKDLPNFKKAVEKAAKDAGRTRAEMEEEVRKFRAFKAFENALVNEDRQIKQIAKEEADIKKYKKWLR